jgi:hypothetical protein
MSATFAFALLQVVVIFLKITVNSVSFFPMQERVDFALSG